MSVGEALAEARRQAGLSVTEVSRRTRIREAIIGGIERDDYSGCGGDFYARGHIRAIARLVGADPGPLIREYHASRPVPRPVTAADLFRPVTPVRIRERRGLNWAAVLGLALLVALGFAAHHVMSSSRHPAGAAAGTAAGPHRAVRGHAGRVAASAAPKTTRAAEPYAGKVVIRLTAIEDCWVEFTTRGGGYLFQSYVVGGTSKTWTFRYAVNMRLGNPGGVRLAVDGKNPLPPGPSPPVTLTLGLNGKISS